MFMNHAQTIALYQPMLQTIAYNLVRCKEDAEDIVQDTFVKWLSIDLAKVENVKAYLTAAVTNACLNHLNSLRKKKETYLDNLHVSDLLKKFKETNLGHLDLDVKLSAAFAVLQHKLEPLERAAYLLKEVFDYEYDELQHAVEKKKEHCRQLVCRAKKKLADETSKIHLDLPDAGELMRSFREACMVGNASQLIETLKKDIATAW